VFRLKPKVGRHIQRIGEVAYKLELPASSQVHPVVHVSQLKKHIPANTQVHTSLNLMSDDPIFALVPAKVLCRSLIPHGVGTATRIKVRWSGDPPYLETWEDPDALCRSYPDAPACGQAVLKRGGVMSYPGDALCTCTGYSRWVCWAMGLMSRWAEEWGELSRYKAARAQLGRCPV
jgi:hypothetical protein